MDTGKYTTLVFIDLKKAFDTVDHGILLKKMQKYGVSGNELAWFTSYLQDRRQLSKVDGVSSRIKKKYTVVYLRDLVLDPFFLESISMTFRFVWKGAR